MNRGEIMRVARMAVDENRRAMEHIRIPGYPRPYFLSYLIRDQELTRLEARFGSVFCDESERRRSCFCDVRVGSYKTDQVQDGGLDDNDTEDESYEYVRLPVGSDLRGVQHGLWRLTEARYRESVEALLRKKGDALTYVDKHRRLRAFEEREPIEHTRWRELPAVDRARWLEFVRRASEVHRRFDSLKHGLVELHVRNATHTFVSSEGSVIVQRRAYWHLQVYMWLLTRKGVGLPHTLTWFVRDPAELPSLETVRAHIRDAVHRLESLGAAPTLRSYAGPVLLDPRPAGLLMHEAVGHRLEGNRLLAGDEGQTFRDAEGRLVLPQFLSMYDDPRLERFDGHTATGHYEFDDEGVPAQRANLIERGELKGWLTTRAGIARDHRSNGHARADFHERPISRMGVTVVEAENGLDDAALKAALVAEVKRQRLPFGIRILEATNGETSTDAYDFQAFLGQIDLAAKVYPDGREEWIRGVDFVGTPVNAIRSIIAAGARQEIDNAFCAAESGDVPVSTISPALLVSHLELQRRSDKRYTQYAYPLPWVGGEREAGDSSKQRRA